MDVLGSKLAETSENQEVVDFYTHFPLALKSKGFFFFFTKYFANMIKYLNTKCEATISMFKMVFLHQWTHLQV